LRLLTEAHFDVTVVATQAALKFVGEPTWAALSGKRVGVDLFDEVHEVAHVRLGQQADLVLVVPATADVLARAAHGLADDLLTNVLLTAGGPVVFAPAMHTEMWNHPATVANVATLRSRGAIVIEPAVGRLTGADSGVGRLPEPAEIAEVARRVLSRGRAGLHPDLIGRRVVVSAGGTREALDPVRFLGNRSSGRQGYALAMTAVARGAEVTLISANVALPDPAGTKIVRVESADELRAAVLEAASGADAVVMAAAVADFRPATMSASKIKKSDAEPAAIELTLNADVLAELSHADRAGRAAQVIVGFAAETDDVMANGHAKLARKGADLLVVNEVGGGKGFEVADNAGVILGSDGTVTQVPAGPKAALADVVWDLIASRLGRPPAVS
jgi:phosphopantothenoylcysteine decarboxylase/phosphopantothenate--cysteine ligase